MWLTISIVSLSYQEIPKSYEPGQVEGRIYQFWLERGYFTPQIDPSRAPFVITMPPTNVTGELHLGHALTATIEDIMIRWHRMRGEPTLWLPGVDHAGIATQVVVERELAKEGLTRQELGQERFTERIWNWVSQCRHIIMEQHRRLGVSCDWARERFTLDEGPSRAVRTAFVNLYNKGLIYRGERIISWCPHCHTAISDLEVVHKELNGHLYYIRYPLSVDATGKEEQGFVTVATTRPETLLGDTAIAVNPDDKRYHGIIGREVLLPILHRPIPIIADSAVDPSFGTGAVKVTPAHDPADFEISQRHNLPIVNILNPDATLNENAGPYKGSERFACRQDLLAQLKKEGLLEKVEPYTHSVGHCQRCDTIIEPWISKQWFVKVAPLAQHASEVVIQGDITILPEQFTKVYLHWMEDIRDWCISRQLWWGHRIPVWYCNDCGQITVSIDTPQYCSHCHSTNIYQDPDVLDTWFSSALWPHSTLGWPDDTEDLRYFYPTSVMETGYDILFFWVARMIMMGLEDTGRIPFHVVYLHGLIRDEQGEKMSKLKGNVLNPLDAIDDYGADALRFALTIGTAPGNDLRISPQKLEWGRNFANKLWNAARFVIHSSRSMPQDRDYHKASLTIDDRWILSRLNRVTVRASQLMEDFQFGEAERLIYDFIWGEFCDWYIEMAKIRIRLFRNVYASCNTCAEEFSPPQPVLVKVLESSLRLLHPFMPFVTEELWQNLISCLPADETRHESIMVSPYPQATLEAVDTGAEQDIESLLEVIRSIRNARAEFKVAASRWIEAIIYTEKKSLFDSYSSIVENFARVHPLSIWERMPPDVGQPTQGFRGADAEPRGVNAQDMVLVLRDAEVVLPIVGMVDLEKQEKRLNREIELCQREIARLKEHLQDDVFLSRAPSSVVEKEREKLAAWEGKMEKLREQDDRWRQRG